MVAQNRGKIVSLVMMVVLVLLIVVVVVMVVVVAAGIVDVINIYVCINGSSNCCMGAQLRSLLTMQGLCFPPQLSYTRWYWSW